jgi:hypothetical protein
MGSLRGLYSRGAAASRRRPRAAQFFFRRFLPEKKLRAASEPFEFARLPRLFTAARPGPGAMRIEVEELARRAARQRRMTLA